MSAVNGRFSVWLAAAVIVAGMQVGCATCPETHVSLDELVREYNADASRVAKLWARARITVTFPVNGGLPFTWSSGTPNGLLLLFKGADRFAPCDFVLVGKETGYEIFRAGSSAIDGKYYFWWRFGDRGQALWQFDPADPVGDGLGPEVFALRRAWPLRFFLLILRLFLLIVGLSQRNK